jgi:hypothetical protein
MVILTLALYMFTEHKMKIIEKEFNVSTGKETITERDATPAEITEAEKAQAEAQIRATKKAEAETAKVAAETKLAALGLTTDDLKALGLGNN